MGRLACAPSRGTPCSLRLTTHTKTLPALMRSVCVVLSVLSLAWVVHYVDWQTLRRTLTHARPLWLVGAGASFGTALALASARWHLVLRMNQFQTRAIATLRTVLIGHLFNTILFGPTGGDLAKAAYYARTYGFKTPAILSTCLIDRSFGGVGFFLFIALTPGFALTRGRWSERAAKLWESPRFGWGLAAAAVGILLLIRFRGHFTRIPSLAAMHETFMKTLRQFCRAPGVAIQAVTLAVLAHLCVAGVFLCCLHAVCQTPFSAAAVLWIFPVISLVTSAPVTFSGVGLRESAALVLLGMYSIPASDAVAAALLVFLIYLVWAALAALLFWRETSNVGNAAPSSGA